MIIAVDAMGGDRAPGVVVQGAVEAARELDIPLILVGDSELIAQELERYPTDDLPISLKHASEVVGMDESPAAALRRKKDSSILVASELVKRGEASALVSAGNTGAVTVAAKLRLGMLKGVERPAIAALLPTLKGVTMLLDVGATVDCKPKHLFQFAVMGEVYTRYILKVEAPEVGLLSIGEEDAKGNEVTRDAFRLLKNSSINFVGNVEGKEVYQGKTDVIVCDGFTGNVALKISESAAEMLGELLRIEFSKSWRTKAAFFLLRRSFRGFRRTIDYTEYGGAPLLGINAPCIIAHGGSTSKAIMNAIRVAGEFVSNRVNERITEDLAAIMDLESPITAKAASFLGQLVGKTKGAGGQDEEDEAGGEEEEAEK
jgi:glycerol-3-phosphate acyltransferase PlsX